MPLSHTRLFAAALVLALGACNRNAPRAQADRGAPATDADQAATPAAPAPPTAAAKPARDTCTLGRALAAWSDSALALRRYGDYVAVRLAIGEIAAQPPASAAPAATVDSAAARLCQRAREQKLDLFLAAYRPTAPRTSLTPAVVRTLGELAPFIVRSMSGPDVDDPGAGDSESPGPGAAPPPPVVPRAWLAALIAVIAIAGVGVGLALRWLGHAVGDAARLVDGQTREQKQLGGEVVAMRDQIDRIARSLKDDVGHAQQTTRDEVRRLFEQVRSDLASLRDWLANSRQGDASASAGWPATGGGYADSRGAPLVINSDAFALTQWEETTVDIRPADGGSASIHADGFGVFTVQWARGSESDARLSVDPTRLIGAALRDKLDAAFQCQGLGNGSGKYRMVHPASCSWDPGTGQGRIIRRGVVEEAG